jgi:hypothetical protein
LKKSVQVADIQLTNTFTRTYYVHKLGSTCKIINLPLVLYDCEMWFLTPREKHKLQVIENRMIRKVFIHRRNEVSEHYYIRRFFVIYRGHQILLEQ